MKLHHRAAIAVGLAVPASTCAPTAPAVRGRTHHSATPPVESPTTVTEIVFAGERCRYLCQCDGGVPIILKEASSATIRRRIVGERVVIAWSVADTVVI